MRAMTNWENKKRSKLHCPSRKHQQKPQTNDIHHVHVPYTSPTVLSTVTMTPTINSTETKDLKTPAVNNNEVSHDVATHPVLEAELPSLPHVCVQPNSMAKRGNMIPPIRDTLGIPRSPTDIEVIDLTIDRSENSSDEPPKKKGKTTTIDVMVIVTMPGLVDPVVKKIQCTVDQESDWDSKHVEVFHAVHIQMCFS